MKNKLIFVLSLLALSGTAYGAIDTNYIEKDVEVRAGLVRGTTMEANATAVEINMFKATGTHTTYAPVQVKIKDGAPDSEQYVYFPMETVVEGNIDQKKLTTKTVPVTTADFTAVGKTNNTQAYRLELDPQGEGKFEFNQVVEVKDVADIGTNTEFNSTADLLVGIKQI